MQFVTSFQLLVSCIKLIDTNIKVAKDATYYLNEEVKVPDIEAIVTKSMKTCCEGKYFLFLHMICTIIQKDVESPLNEMLNSKPLHHAAAAGCFPNVAYLINTQGAKCDSVDRSGNTPVHNCYMNVHNKVM